MFTRVFATITASASIIIMFCLCAGQAFAADDMVPVAYTANPALNTVSVIDLRDNTIFATVYDVNSSAGLAISPDARWLYVTNGEINNVTYINMTSFHAVDTIPVGNAPRGIAMTPDGETVYVANYLDNTVTVIDTASKKANGTISVGKGPCGIRVNPVTGEAYVVNSDEGTISVIRGKDVVATITAGNHTTKGLAVTPDGTLLLAVNKDNNTVSVINTTSYKVMNTVDTGRDPTGIAITPNGWYAFITNPGSGNISDMQISDSTIRVSFNVSDPALIGFHPDGKTAYVTTDPASNIRIIDSATGEVKATIDVPAADMEIATIGSSMLADTVPPVTTLTRYGENDSNGSYIGKVVCNITAVDYPSGTELKSSEYSFDGMTWAPYGGNFTLTTPIRSIVYYRSADKAGNEEWPKSKVIYVVAGATEPGPTMMPTIPPANGSIWTGPSVPGQGASPQVSGTPKPTGGFEVILAAIGILGGGYLIRKRL